MRTGTTHYLSQFTVLGSRRGCIIMRRVTYGEGGIEGDVGLCRHFCNFSYED